VGVGESRSFEAAVAGRSTRQPGEDPPAPLVRPVNPPVSLSAAAFTPEEGAISLVGA
jgi:hypothetical protein